jgi:hypothetical protein
MEGLEVWKASANQRQIVQTSCPYLHTSKAEMSAPSAKQTLREQIGVAVNTSSLTLRANVETGLERIAGLGAAALAIQHGADRAGLPVAALQAEVICRSAGMRTLMQAGPRGLDQQDVIVAELAPTLWHIRYGGQLELVPRAADLFAAWCAYRTRFAALPEAERAERLPRLAIRALHEWLSDRCPASRGCGKQEILRTGQRVQPRGTMQRNAVFRVCEACRGSGRARASQGERARHLGLDRATFERGHWDKHIKACLAWLRTLLITRPDRPLTQQLERRKKRS